MYEPDAIQIAINLPVVLGGLVTAEEFEVEVSIRNDGAGDWEIATFCVATPLPRGVPAHEWRSAEIWFFHPAFRYLSEMVNAHAVDHLDEVWARRELPAREAAE